MHGCNPRAMLSLESPAYSSPLTYANARKKLFLAHIIRILILVI